MRWYRVGWALETGEGYRVMASRVGAIFVFTAFTPVHPMGQRKERYRIGEPVPQRTEILGSFRAQGKSDEEKRAAAELAKAACEEHWEAERDSRRRTGTGA